MTALSRFLLVCVFALLGMRGANACEHMGHEAHITHMAFASGGGCDVARHAHTCADCADHSDCAHHAGCCGVGGCTQCGLPLHASRVDADTLAHHAPSAWVAALRAGITHAPPLPPPIV